MRRCVRTISWMRHGCEGVGLVGPINQGAGKPAPRRLFCQGTLGAAVVVAVKLKVEVEGAGQVALLGITGPRGLPRGLGAEIALGERAQTLLWSYTPRGFS